MNKSPLLQDILDQNTLDSIKIWIEKFPPEHKRSALLPILLSVQKYNKGFLTDTLLQAVANYLSIPLIDVQEVATFYSMLELKEVGKYKLCFCTNISCMLNKSDELVAHVQKKLGIQFGETTTDGKFTLKEVECLGACVNAPVMQLEDKYYEKLTPQKIDNILDSLE